MDWNASIAILPPMPFLLVRGSPSDAKLCNPKATESVFEFWAVCRFLWGAKFSLFQILLTFSKISMQQKNASIESFFFFIWKCEKWGGMCTGLLQPDFKLQIQGKHWLRGLWHVKSTLPGVFIFLLGQSTAELFLTSIRTVARLAYLYQSEYLWLHWTVQFVILTTLAEV